jgi:hypothetical protein
MNRAVEKDLQMPIRSNPAWRDIKVRKARLARKKYALDISDFAP